VSWKENEVISFREIQENKTQTGRFYMPESLTIFSPHLQNVFL